MWKEAVEARYLVPSHCVRFEALTAASMKFRVFGDVVPCSHLKFFDVSEVRTASIIIARMIEAVRTTETAVNCNVTTRYYIPEDSKLHTTPAVFQKD
jgi:hypothetical protein